MALKFRSIRLPFLRISSSRKGKRSFVWHVGPWSYSSATGAHSVKLTKKVRYVTKSRAQKAAAAKVAAKRRAAERAAWDEQIAATNGRGTPVEGVDYRAGKTPAGATYREAIARKTAGELEDQGFIGGGARPLPRDQVMEAHTVAGRTRWVAVQPADRAVDEPFLTLRQRQERLRAAGLCGARTRDGSPCLNAGNCPHHPRGGRA